MRPLYHSQAPQSLRYYMRRDGINVFEMRDNSDAMWDAWAAICLQGCRDIGEQRVHARTLMLMHTTSISHHGMCLLKDSPRSLPNALASTAIVVNSAAIAFGIGGMMGFLGLIVPLNITFYNRPTKALSWLQYRTLELEKQGYFPYGQTAQTVVH